MTGFCFDTARDIATHVLARWKKHRDFDDLVSETVIAAWKTSEKRPELDLVLMVTCAAKWQLSAWFRSKRCGDLISSYRNARIVVQTMPWTKDGTAEIELSDFEPDFSARVIDRLSPAETKRDDSQLQWAAWLEKCDLLSYYREAARLHYCEGWSMRRAAEQLGLTSRAVNEAIRNSRRRMEMRSR